MKPICYYMFLYFLQEQIRLQLGVRVSGYDTLLINSQIISKMQEKTKPIFSNKSYSSCYISFLQQPSPLKKLKLVFSFKRKHFTCIENRDNQRNFNVGKQRLHRFSKNKSINNHLNSSFQLVLGRLFVRCISIICVSRKSMGIFSVGILQIFHPEKTASEICSVNFQMHYKGNMLEVYSKVLIFSPYPKDLIP